MRPWPERLAGPGTSWWSAPGRALPTIPTLPIGNGRAISVLAAQEGAAVACVEWTARAAAETARLVAEAKARTPVVVVGDVADEAACERVIEESAAALGGIDGLVCNVGIGLGRGLAGTSPAEWDAVHTVNVRAHFLLCRAALPLMTEGGSIVLISSIAGLRPGTRIPAYDTTEGRARRGWVGTSRSRARARVCAPTWSRPG